MNENQVMYLVSIFCFFLIIFTFKFNKQFAFINVIIFIIYNIYFYYGLFNGKEGTSLGWLILLIIVTILQILLLSIFILAKLYKK